MKRQTSPVVLFGYSSSDTLDRLRGLVFNAPDTLFDVEGKSYRQVDGVAVGNILVRTLAVVFLSVREKRMYDSLQALLYKGYVDDFFKFFTDPNHNQY